MAKTNTHEAAEIAFRIKGIFENIRETAENYLAYSEENKEFKNPDIAIESIAIEIDKYNKL